MIGACLLVAGLAQAKSLQANLKQSYVGALKLSGPADAQAMARLQLSRKGSRVQLALTVGGVYRQQSLPPTLKLKGRVVGERSFADRGAQGIELELLLDGRQVEWATARLESRGIRSLIFEQFGLRLPPRRQTAAGTTYRQKIQLGDDGSLRLVGSAQIKRRSFPLYRDFHVLGWLPSQPRRDQAVAMTFNGQSGRLFVHQSATTPFVLSLPRKTAAAFRLPEVEQAVKADLLRRTLTWLYRWRVDGLDTSRLEAIAAADLEVALVHHAKRISGTVTVNNLPQIGGGTLPPLRFAFAKLNKTRENLDRLLLGYAEMLGSATLPEAQRDAHRRLADQHWRGVPLDFDLAPNHQPYH